MTPPQTVSVNLIRTAFESEHVPALFTGQGTHDAALRFVAQLVPHTQNVEYITGLIRAFVSEGYCGNTLSEVPRMVRDAIKKDFDKRETFEDKAEKLSAANDLIKFIEDNEKFELFNNYFDGVYISVTENKKTRVYDLRSTAAQLFLKFEYYSKNGRVITSTGFREAHETLIAKALYESPSKIVHLRIAREGEQITFNPAKSSGETIIIDKDGWKISTYPIVAFVNSPLANKKFIFKHL